MGSNLTPQEFSDAEFADELKPGTKLLHGQYEIEEFLNNGGFGITYLAKDSLHRLVVIKECFPESMCSRRNTTVRVRSRTQAEMFRTIVDLFIEEARSLARLSHPNIVGVHQVFEDNDTAYMAMDFVEGKDLLAVAEGQERIAPDALEKIVVKLLDAIGFIHREGVLHRDISPDNILLGKDDEPVLIDFGAARENVSRANSYLASLRTVKDGYSPQEFYLNNSEQHPSSDLYSLAASLYHVMSKQLPVSAQKRMTAIAGGEDDPYVSIKQHVSGYSEVFLDAIDHALRVFPKDRIQTAEEWQALITGMPTFDATRGTVSRPMLAVENGNVLEQFEEKGSEAEDRQRSLKPTKPRSVRQKSALRSHAAEVGAAFEKTDFDALSSRKGSSGKGLYIGVAAAAVLILAGTGAFLLTDQGDPEVATTEAASGATPIDQVASSDAASETSRRPEQVPFFLAETSEGDVTVSSASGRLASGGTPQRNVTPNPAQSQDDPANSVSFTDILDSDPASSSQTTAADTASAEQNPDVPVESAPDLSTDVSPVITAKTVSFPVQAEDSDPAIVATVEGALVDHIEPGHRILSVNGFPIEALSEFQRVLNATAEYSVGENVLVNLGVEDPATGETFVRSVELPAGQQTLLLNGVGFETIRGDDGWTTFVTSGSGSEQSDLQRGDRIVALMPNNELIADEDAIARVLRREVQNGTTRFSFAVMRDGEMWLTEMQYAASVSN